jgi:hypothetical protein
MLAKSAKTSAKSAKVILNNSDFFLFTVLGARGARLGALGEHLVLRMP